jgi:hypothetical protein
MDIFTGVLIASDLAFGDAGSKFLNNKIGEYFSPKPGHRDMTESRALRVGVMTVVMVVLMVIVWAFTHGSREVSSVHYPALQEFSLMVLGAVFGIVLAVALNLIVFRVIRDVANIDDARDWLVIISPLLALAITLLDLTYIPTVSKWNPIFIAPLVALPIGYMLMGMAIPFSSVFQRVLVSKNLETNQFRTASALGLMVFVMGKLVLVFS